MSYLERRIEYLLSLRKEGKLHLEERFLGDDTDEAISQLRAIQRDGRGLIDLQSCGPLVRFLASTVYSMKDLDPTNDPPVSTPESTAKPRDPISDQRELFSLLDEFFHRATGKSAQDFAAPEGFGQEIKRNSEIYAQRGEEAFKWAWKNLPPYYARQEASAYEPSRGLGGMKLVIGGSGRFTPTTLRAVRSMALYADTQLIPDPLLPWLETPRSEERFRHMEPLEAVFLLLQLKPLVDADLPSPPVLVFPSWEKTLESKDEIARDGIGRLVLDFFSFYLNARFEDESEVFNFARSYPDEFLRAVDAKGLFVAPGGDGTESTATALQLYKDQNQAWRSKEYLDSLETRTDAELIALGICERLLPQFHLRSNAEALLAQPMVWLSAHWHYFQLCAGMCESDLSEQSLLSKESISTLRAMNRPGFEWLGNVPIEALVELRRNNENEHFRRTLRNHTDFLHESAMGDVDRVAGEVGRGIASLLAEHQQEVKRIDSKYRVKYMKEAGAGWITLAAAIVPLLAPLLPTATALGLSAKYAWDKIDERSERKQLSRSLTGVLAAAARTPTGK